MIENGSIVYDVSGPLFFGSAACFWELFDLIEYLETKNNNMLLELEEELKGF